MISPNSQLYGYINTYVAHPNDKSCNYQTPCLTIADLHLAVINLFAYLQIFATNPQMAIKQLITAKIKSVETVYTKTTMIRLDEF